MPEKPNAMISAHRLVKRLNRKVVLGGLNLQVYPGDISAVIGPNGAGKTTLLRILATLMRPDAGEVLICGFNMYERPEQTRRKIGVITHQPLNYGDLTVEENLRFYARLYGIKNAGERISCILPLVDLIPRRNDLARTLSRGMQQRLAISRALLHEPDILLMDEPFTGLDQETAESLSEYFKQWVRTGRCILMTGHDLTLVETSASRFEFLSGGKIVASRHRVDLDKGELAILYREINRGDHTE